MNHTTALLLALLLGLFAGAAAFPDKGFVWTDLNDDQVPLLALTSEAGKAETAQR